jgi:hypothetical protein
MWLFHGKTAAEECGWSEPQAKKDSSYLPVPYLPSRRVERQIYIYFIMSLSFFPI